LDLAKARLDVVTGWPDRCSKTTLMEPLHVFAIRLQNGAIVRLGPRRLGQPPYVLDRVANTDPPYGNPFGRHRHLGRVEPEALLREVKDHVLNECDEEFEVIE